MSVKEKALRAVGHTTGNLIGTAAEIGGNRYARHSAFTLDPEGYLVGKGVSFAGNQLKKRLRSK